MLLWFTSQNTWESNLYEKFYIVISPWATLPLGPKISQKQCCSSYVLKISVVQGIISVAQEILQKTVKSALLKVNTELFKNRVVSRTALLEVVLLKDLLYICKYLFQIAELCGSKIPQCSWGWKSKQIVHYKSSSRK